MKSNPKLNSLSRLFAYPAEIRAARERVRGKISIGSSSSGEIEYTQGGVEPAVLMIHGAGGGYDQAELIGQAVPNEGFAWIDPSRFGYLRSGFRVGATLHDQA